MGNNKTSKIISPIYLIVPRVTKKDKKYALNMNAYRNWQHHLNNDLKVRYKKIMEDQLKWKTFKTPIGITYTLYWAYKSDLMNVVAIVDKFFCDALQEFWCIPEDDVLHLIETHAVVWWKDRENPRMEITIL